MPIQSTIQPGSVYYFADPCLSPSEEPHFFIVINLDPLGDNILLLVCSHSKVEHIKRMRRIHPGTTVEIDPSIYKEFKALSIVDCNVVFQKSIDELNEKYKGGKLRFKTVIPIEIIEKLREAVLESVVVERYIKEMLI